ncbi:MAG: choice-of-anchor Q domain-containing protein [Verrucomicrobiota bacterium]
MKLPAGLIAAVVASAGANAQAATLLVSNTNDSGAGSLRQAVVDNNNTAGGGNTITFSNVVTGTITLISGELLISSNVTILGPGPASLAVNGNAASRVFHITNAANATISGLTITNGAVSGSYPGNVGGGIWNDSSALTVSNCSISGNHGGSGPAGGIFNDHSTLTLRNCTVSGNSTGGSGGAIENYGYAGSATLLVSASTFSGNDAGGAGNVGGAIFNDGNQGSATLSVSNSTFSDNSAAQYGGAIYNAGANGTAATVLTVRASTFNGNDAGTGLAGTIYNNGASATVRLGDTIVNTASAQTSIVNANATFISDGYNLSSDNGGGVLTNATDQLNKDPLLGPLADNGGPTFTHALLPGSPAIDKGKTFGLTIDQRGVPRPFDFASITNAPGGDGSDIGAFEVGGPRLGIQQIGNAAVLSWLAYSAGFTLQSSTNVASSNSWVTAGGSAALVGNQYQQTNSPLSANLFFRLRGN